MKQVTMESVKQRINELTSTGIVSLRGEFELACLCQLVAVTEQRDALATEFAKFKTAQPQPFGPEMMKALEAYEWHQDDVPETGMLNAFFILRDSIVVETPATSSAIAALRAEAKAEALDEMAATYRGYASEDDCSCNMKSSYNLTAERAENYAAYVRRQLRESKGADHE